MRGNELPAGMVGPNKPERGNLTPENIAGDVLGHHASATLQHVSPPTPKGRPSSRQCSGASDKADEIATVLRDHHVEVLKRLDTWIAREEQLAQDLLKWYSYCPKCGSSADPHQAPTARSSSRLPSWNPDQHLRSSRRLPSYPACSDDILLPHQKSLGHHYLRVADVRLESETGSIIQQVEEFELERLDRERPGVSPPSSRHSRSGSRRATPDIRATPENSNITATPTRSRRFSPVRRLPSILKKEAVMARECTIPDPSGPSSRNSPRQRGFDVQSLNPSDLSGSKALGHLRRHLGRPPLPKGSRAKSKESCAGQSTMSHTMEHWRRTAQPIAAQCRSELFADQELAGQTRLQRFVASHRFECMAAVAIAISALAMGAEVQYMAVTKMEQTPLPFLVLSHACTGVLFLEIGMRVYTQRWKFLCGLEWAWNWFDVLIVLASLVEVAFDVANYIVDDPLMSRLSSIGASSRILRVLRVARLVRVIRMARIIRFIRPLRILIHSIMTTLRSVCWALALLSILIYCFAILFTQATTNYDLALVQGNDVWCPDAAATLEDRWGSLPLSMLTLYMSVTGGLDWHMVMCPLSHLSFAWVVLFLLYITFTIFAVLNVVTGAFCQGALESKQYDREQMIESLLANKRTDVMKIADVFTNVFKSIDADQSGTISLDEFEAHLHDDSVQALFAMLEIEPADALTLFGLLDLDESQELNPEEFVSGFLRLKGSARSIDMARMMHQQKHLSKQVRHLQTYLSSELASLRGQTRPALWGTSSTATAIEV